jgi:hypothetical protein
MNAASQLRGGEVVITRFDCRTILNVAVLVLVHVAVKQNAKRRCDGLLASTAIVSWKDRRILSISLWRQRSDIFTMGRVQRHIFAARVPHHLGVETSCGVYSYAGDWRRVMFGWDVEHAAPLEAI